MRELTLQVEKPRVREGAPPPRLGRIGNLRSVVLTMARGEWSQVTHAQAKSMQRVVRELGGSATRYRTSEVFSCVKVLDAPWMQEVAAAATEGTTS